jgi:hypothetical protein
MTEKRKFGAERFKFPDGASVKVGGFAWDGALYGGTRRFETCGSFTVGIFPVLQGKKHPKAGKAVCRVKGEYTKMGSMLVALQADRICAALETAGAKPARKLFDLTGENPRHWTGESREECMSESMKCDHVSKCGKGPEWCRHAGEHPSWSKRCTDYWCPEVSNWVRCVPVVPNSESAETQGTDV